MPVTVYPRGTTLFEPQRCWSGYTLVILRDGESQGRANRPALIDMNGRIVRVWEMDPAAGVQGLIHRVRLLPNGNITLLRIGDEKTKTRAGVQDYSWEGGLVWEYVSPPDAWPHHDFYRKNDGATLLVCKEAVPERIRMKARHPLQRQMLFADAIREISPAGQLLWEWHQYDSIPIERQARVIAPPDWWAGIENNSYADWTHTNTVRPLPENRWFDSGDARFRPGNVLVMLRQLDVAFIVDRETKRIVWEYTGDYKGGLAGPHEAEMIPKGIPGAGNILMFDNGCAPQNDLQHAGRSFILEVEPATKQVVWVYDPGECLHSNFSCSCQRLPNGNTMALESAHGRIFELTPEKEIVWEYVFDHLPCGPRAYRYAWDHCPQLAALGRPDETPVAPPEGWRRRPV